MMETRSTNPARFAAEWISRILATGPLNQQVLRNSLVVFLYHEVSGSPSEFNCLHGLAVHPDHFSRQLDLIRSGFHIIDPQQLLRGDYPRPAALITFDDGNRSYFQEALPILTEKQMPSLAFLNMGPVLGEACWSGLVSYLQHHEPDFLSRDGRRLTGCGFRDLNEQEVLAYLETQDSAALLKRAQAFRGLIASEADLRKAANNRLVTFGNHLYNHYNATLLSDRLREEYRKNQRLIEDYPCGSELVSYPFGCWNQETTRVLLKEGARALFLGGGLPNFNTRGPLFHRVELDDAVMTEAQLYRAVFRNLLPASIRGQISWS